MHINVYRLMRPLSRQARCSSFLVILTKSHTILQQDLPKPHYFDTPCLKPGANTLQNQNPPCRKRTGDLHSVGKVDV